MNAITKGNGSGTEMKPALPGALGRTQAVSALRGAFEGHTGPLLAQARPSWPLVPKHSEAGELWQPPVGHCLLHWDLLGPPCSPHAGHPVCVPDVFQA